jgi:hypothetical protein
MWFDNESDVESWFDEDGEVSQIGLEELKGSIIA